MEYNKTIKVSTRIIILFSTAIFLSFIPEYLHSFFGDYKCGGYMYDWNLHKYTNQSCDITINGNHNPTWHWGYRHWLWLAMGICLSIIQFVNILTIIIEE